RHLLERLREGRVGREDDPPPAIADASLPERFRRLRETLCLLDVRFAELTGGRGVFTSLDASGPLPHAQVDEQSVATAAHNPPSFPPRPAVRGRLVRELATFGERYHAGWSMVRDQVDRRDMHLESEFDDSPQWQDPSPLPTRASLRGSLEHAADSILGQAERRLSRGFYTTTQRYLREIDNCCESAGAEPLPGEMTVRSRRRRRRLKIWASVRLGTEVDVEHLASAPQATTCLWTINDRLYHARFGLPLPDLDEMAIWLEQSQRAQRDADDDPAYAETDWQRENALLTEHRAAYFLGRGMHDEAMEAAYHVIAGLPGASSDAIVRACATLGQAQFVAGRYDDAQRAFHRAPPACFVSLGSGDCEEYLIPYRTALLTPMRARRSLLLASRRLEGAYNYVGAARCLLMAARRTTSGSRLRALRARIERLHQSIPRRLASAQIERIMAHWPQWLRPATPATYLPCAAWLDE
ncbi:MAG: proteasome accessory factor PafA2 family protein, partial [Planctomycetales bacterium]|nr:proteasome accessory factor PafA2 family protein [Planctomycetales bacterium]